MSLNIVIDDKQVIQPTYYLALGYAVDQTFYLIVDKKHQYKTIWTSTISNMCIIICHCQAFVLTLLAMKISSAIVFKMKDTPCDIHQILSVPYRNQI